MAGKRIADTELNHDNWDREEQVEEAGTFKKAPEEVIKNRVIKVAKRRNPIGTLAAAESEKKGVFSSFPGFGKPTSDPNKSFGFLTTLSQNAQQKTNGVDSLVSKTANEKTDSKSEEYYGKLKGLNESVSKWIKQHVDSNPFLNLTPIFKDYERYLEEIEKLKPNETDSIFQTKPLEAENKTTENSLQKDVSFIFKPATSESENLQTIFKLPEPKETPSTIIPETPKSTFSVENKNAVTTSGFSFILPTAQNATSPTTATSSQAFSFGSSDTHSTPSFSFGIPKSSATTSGFSFTNSTPFTFQNVQNAEANSESNKEADPDEEPPKNEFKPVVEEGHVYTIRCKVFVKKDKAFADRGVGSLYLKPIPNSEKMQLIVRADTNLGNVLLNFILSKNIPLQRMGKKDVMVVTLPTPDSKPPPVPILLRVKSPEDADNLLKELEKHKK